MVSLIPTMTGVSAQSVLERLDYTRNEEHPQRTMAFQWDGAELGSSKWDMSRGIK